MKPDEMEMRLRAGEAYHNLRVAPGLRIVVRVDGRSFSRITDPATKPFDPQVHTAMVDVATELVREWNAPYGCTHSDEVSVLLPDDAAEAFLFNRSVEKLVSISAGLASSIWNGHWALEGPFLMGGHFDARLWVGSDEDSVVDYFRWRLADAERNAASSTAYWALRKEGLSARAATSILRGQSSMELRQFLQEKHDIAFEDLPAEQRHGTGLHWEEYIKEGYNPLTGETVPATRRRIVSFPLDRGGEDYPGLLRRIGVLSYERREG